MKFYRRLNDSERASYDLEDLLLEVWIALRERDDKYDSSRANYLTFARPIIRNCLSDLREKAHTVVTPNKWSDLIREAQEHPERLSERRLATAEAVRRTMRSTVEAKEEHRIDDEDITDVLSEEETRSRAAELLVGLVCEISNTEALVAGALFGLWGQDKLPLALAARECGMTVHAVKRIRNKIAELLAERLSVLAEE